MKNSIQKKIKSCGVLAGAFLAASPIVKGDIVHTDVSPDDVINQPDMPAYIDLDGDGNNDFKIVMRENITSTYSSHGPAYNKDKFIKIKGLANGLAVAGTPNSPRWNAELIQQGAAIQNGNQNFTTEAQIVHMSMYESAWSATDASCLFSDFSGNSQALVALRFKIGNNFHYGWVRLSVSTCVDTQYNSSWWTHYEDMEVQIKDFGYESIPNGVCYAGWKQYYVGIEVNSITHNSATFSFLPVPGIDHFKLFHRKAGEVSWDTQIVPAGTPWSAQITALQNNTDYEYKAQGYLDAAETVKTGWTQIRTFNTGCFVPDSAATSVFSGNHAKIEWEPVDGAVDGYQIRGRRQGSNGWVTLNVGAGITDRHFYGLQPGVSYEWKVRSICKAQFYIYSDFTPLQTFTMLSGNRLANPEIKDPLVPEASDELLVYPAPARNEVTVELPQGFNSNKIAIHILDLSGKKQSVAFVSDGEKMVADVSHISSGFYMLVIENEKEVMTKKLIISK